MVFNQKKILVVGGGFAGISTALSLAKYGKNYHIRLVTDKSHFEYHAALYRVVTGKSPLEVCIPLAEIFKGKSVEITNDKIIKVDPANHLAAGSSGSEYNYDYLVLALGSETVYFNIPGLKELSFGFKSITEALRLKRHLHEVFETCKISNTDDKICAAHLVIVGGGASGVELAGELAVYSKRLAKEHQLDPSLITIDLIEAAPRLLPIMSEDVSKKAYQRLHNLGINIFLNRAVVEEEIQSVHLKDMELKTKTVIWTAGIKPNFLYGQVPGLQLDKKGRVLVNDFLEAQGVTDIFITGDGAATQYSGMAQTAIYDGRYVAEMIYRKFRGQKLRPFRPKKPFYSIPIGPGWAATVLGPIKLYGYLGWLLRRFADFRYFFSVLPLKKAIAVFRKGKTICESCEICEA